MSNLPNVTCIVSSKHDWVFDIFAMSYLETISYPLIVLHELTDDIRNKYSMFQYVDAPVPFSPYSAWNIGIKLSENDDVVLLTDDLYLHTTNMVEKLQQVAYAEKGIGCVGPLLETAQNPQQHPANQPPCPMGKAGWIPYMVTQDKVDAESLYIKRTVIDDIGLFDENFRWYRGHHDFALRVRLAGYLHAICYAVFVQHGGPIYGNGKAITATLTENDINPDLIYWEKKQKELAGQ